MRAAGVARAPSAAVTAPKCQRCPRHAPDKAGAASRRVLLGGHRVGLLSGAQLRRPRQQERATAARLGLGGRHQ